MNKTIRILQLYPKEMNIYGDWGNVLTLKKRLEWRGYQTEILEQDIGSELNTNVDLIIGGGGQDSGQKKVAEDLRQIAPALKKLADEGMPMLVICGMYQLFGKYFRTENGDLINGIGIFSLETKAERKRLIGDIVIESEQFGLMIGYENHSGLTFLDKDQSYLGKVLRGSGNNGQDGSEGAIYKNTVGSYMHGSILPKNPKLADWLIAKAIERKFGESKLPKLDDSLANKARKYSLDLKR